MKRTYIFSSLGSSRRSQCSLPSRRTILMLVEHAGWKPIWSWCSVYRRPSASPFWLIIRCRHVISRILTKTEVMLMGRSESIVGVSPGFLLSTINLPVQVSGGKLLLRVISSRMQCMLSSVASSFRASRTMSSGMRSQEIALLVEMALMAARVSSIETSMSAPSCSYSCL